MSSAARFEVKFRTENTTVCIQAKVFAGKIDDPRKTASIEYSVFSDIQGVAQMNGYLELQAKDMLTLCRVLGTKIETTSW